MGSTVEISQGIFRGPRPSEDVMAGLKLKTIINLESGWYERLHPRAPRELSAAERLGIAEVSLPMSDFTPPKASRVAHAVRLMARPLLRPLLVHCRSGVDRTGVVVACFRVAVEAWKAETALEEMLWMGFHRWRYCWWIPTIRRLLASAETWRETCRPTYSPIPQPQVQS